MECPSGCACDAEDETGFIIQCHKLGWTAFPVFTDLVGVGRLSFDENDITECLPGMLATKPSGVTGLNFQHNRISRIDPGAFKWFPNVSLLLLSSNELTEIATGCLEDLPRLAIFHIPNNKFRALPTFPALPITTLKLDNNHLMVKPTRQLFSNVVATLRILSIQNIGLNNLGLDADLLSEMSALVSLDLTDNDLSELPDTLFDGLKNLSTVAMPVMQFWGRSVGPRVNLSFVQTNLFRKVPFAIIKALQVNLRFLYA